MNTQFVLYLTQIATFTVLLRALQSAHSNGDQIVLSACCTGRCKNKLQFQYQDFTTSHVERAAVLTTVSVRINTHICKFPFLCLHVDFNTVASVSAMCIFLLQNAVQVIQLEAFQLPCRFPWRPEISEACSNNIKFYIYWILNSFL